jgi:predicted nucleic acid-binding protein
MTIFGDDRDILAVIDTMIFVPAIAGAPEESRFYSTAIQKCWKFVFSIPISEQYQKIMHLYGYPGAAVQLELSKLSLMNKYRESTFDPENVPPNLAPRKDRHIVAPCLNGQANLIVTDDEGILEKADAIRVATGGLVLSLSQASLELKTMRNCLPSAY